MPAVRLVVALLLTLLLLASGSGLCVPMATAAPVQTASGAPPCHGTATADLSPTDPLPTDPASDAAHSTSRPDTSPGTTPDAAASCVRCPLCATVVPALVAPAPGPLTVRPDYAAAVSTVAEAPAVEPSTPPPQR